MAMLDTIQYICPICPDEWNEVVEMHAVKFPDMHHQLEGLQYKFKLLYNKKIKTSDPLCPIKIHCAKEIMKLIEDKKGSCST